MDQKFPIEGTQWDVLLSFLEGGDGTTVSDFRIIHREGKFFQVGMNEVHPMILENLDPRGDRIGEVCVTLRREFHTGRWHVTCEYETWFTSFTESVQTLRATRNSSDNPVKSVKTDEVVYVGDLGSNMRRIALPAPIKCFYRIAGWPNTGNGSKLVMVDVFDFIRDTMDSLGKAVLKMAIDQMEDEQLALTLWRQGRNKSIV